MDGCGLFVCDFALSFCRLFRATTTYCGTNGQIPSNAALRCLVPSTRCAIFLLCCPLCRPQVVNAQARVNMYSRVCPNKRIEELGGNGYGCGSTAASNAELASLEMSSLLLSILSSLEGHPIDRTGSLLPTLRGGHERVPKGLSFCMTCEKMPRKLKQSKMACCPHSSARWAPAPPRPARSAATCCAAAGAHRPTSDTRPCLSRPLRPRYSVVVQTVCPSGVPQSPRCVLCVLDGFVVYFVTGPCYAWC